MKTIIRGVRNPHWVSPGMINCEVLTNHFDDWIPFTAAATDVADHGRQLFNELVQGQHGPIGMIQRREDDAIQENRVAFATDLSLNRLEKFLVEANLENSRGTCRGIGLVWGSMIEQSLREVLDLHLDSVGRTFGSFKDPQQKSQRKDFQNYIDVAMKAELIDRNINDGLHAIREIRNACAHEWMVSFENERFRKLKPLFVELRDNFNPQLLFADNENDLEFWMKLIFGAAAGAILMVLEQKRADILRWTFAS